MEKNVRLLKIIYGLIGFVPVSPLWVLYFAEVAGSVARGAGIFTAAVVIAGLMDLPTGVFSDRMGRRRTAIIGCGSLTLCVVAYGVAENGWMLLVGAVLDGFGMAMLSGNNQALLHESLNATGKGDRYAIEFGRMHGTMHWMMAVSAIVGGIAATESMRLAVWLSLPTFVVATVVALFLQEPVRHSEHASTIRGHMLSTARVVAGNKRLRRIAGASMVSGGVGMALFAMRPVWTQLLWPLWAIGIARSASAVFAAIGTWWGGAIVKRFGALEALTTTQTATSVANVVAIAVPTVVSPAVMTGSSLSYGISTTADSVLLQGEFTDAQRATLGSMVTVGARLIFGLSTLAFGLIADQHGPGPALLIGELLVLASVPVYLSVRRKQGSVGVVEQVV